MKTIRLGRIMDVDREEVARIISKYKMVFQNYILHYASRYPDVKFLLYFPPYSRLYYALRKQSNPQAFEIYIETIKFVVHECERYGNVKVFGFETEPFLNEISNYCDLTHYHQKYNSAMLQWMKNDQHELTISNLDEYLKKIRTLATDCSIEEICKQIIAY